MVDRRPKLGERAARDSVKRRLTAKVNNRVEPKSLDIKERKVTAVLATETPVDRFFGPEILAIEKSAILIDRYLKSPVLLDSHNRNAIANVIGRVEKLRIEKRHLVGDLIFSGSPEGEAAMQKVREGAIRAVSVSYRRRRIRVEKLPDQTTREVVTQWELYEVSLVAVPADQNACIR